MLNPLTAPTTDQERVRRDIMRAAAMAANTAAPLDVLDPRGMIFDRDRSGRWTLRVRGAERQLVFDLGDHTQPWLNANGRSWTLIRIEDDDQLPGRHLLDDEEALSTLVGRAGPLRTSVVTFRRSRRAVLRVESRGQEAPTYVKLLNKKSYHKAMLAFSHAADSGLDCIAQPRLRSPELCALLFDEVEGAALHDRLWAGERISYDLIARGIRDLSHADSNSDLPVRDLTTERDSAVRSIRTATDFLPELEELIAPLEALAIPELPTGGVIHGDLHDKQIFLSGESVRLIDAESLANGSALIDATNLAEHLRLRGFQGCATAPKSAARLLTRLGLDADDEVVRLSRALVRARLAGVYARRPWWWGVAHGMAREARDFLEERS